MGSYLLVHSKMIKQVISGFESRAKAFDFHYAKAIIIALTMVVTASCSQDGGDDSDSSDSSSSKVQSCESDSQRLSCYENLVANSAELRSYLHGNVPQGLAAWDQLVVNSGSVDLQSSLSNCHVTPDCQP